MTIAHVTATFPPYWAGTGNVAYHDTRVLHEAGHAVSVFTAYPAGREPMTFPFPVHYLPAPFRPGNAPLTPSLPAHLRGFDLVHLHWPYIFGAELATLTAALRDIPLVVTYHNDLIAPGGRGAVFRLYNWTSQPLLLRRADGVIVTSLDYGRHSLLRGGRGLRRPPVAVPNGVDTELFTPGPGPDASALRDLSLPPGARYMMFVGGLDTPHFFKGVPVLVEALAAVLDIHAVFVGEGDLRPAFEARAAAAIPGRAHFTGSIDLPRLIALYGGAMVTALPSTTMGEAFGIVLLESLECGAPVIASDLPGVRTLVAHGEDGYLVPPGNATALADAMEFNRAFALSRKIGGMSDVRTGDVTAP